jgi:aspartyl-tRNA(Asn)/glutamyl-tRNA(Gln) amidotransferase subunit A
MQNNQLCYLTIIEAAAALRKNDVSPVDLTEATLKRIQAIDSNLHAFITVTGRSRATTGAPSGAGAFSRQRSRTAARHPHRA